jgi:peptidoglycan/LPS O-acetylase OafA/YrhL
VLLVFEPRPFLAEARATSTIAAPGPVAPSRSRPAPVTAEAAHKEGRRKDGGGLAYRPALDGLRALAVLLVLAFHSGISQFSGGFIGVDLFFVLSGFLVTRLILTDLAAGTFRITDFYGRRVRRLLPAAVLVLVCVSLLWLTIASPVDRANLIPDVRSAALYFSNWHFAAVSTDYFARTDNQSPVLHFWSLSVEEQFYLLWPALILLAWLAARRRIRYAIRIIALTAAVLATASLVALIATVAAGNNDLAYYGSHTRAYQLLGGALLAILVDSTRWREKVAGWTPGTVRGVQFAGLAVLLVLATSWISCASSVRGIGAAIGAIGLLAAMEAAPAAGVAKALSLRTLTYLGQISYGIYLWHYPVIIAFERFVVMSPWLLFIFAGVVSTGLAALSHVVFELPIRRSRQLAPHGSLVIAGGLIISVLAGLLVMPAVLHDQRPPLVRIASTAQGVSGTTPAAGRQSLKGFDLDAAQSIPNGSDAAGPTPQDRTCTTGPWEQCELTQGTGKKVLLLGDSHAGMLAPAFRAIGRRNNLTVVMAFLTGCPWQQGLVFANSDHKLCETTKALWMSKLIPEFKPDVIVLASRATDHTVGSTYNVESTNGALHGNESQLLAEATKASLPLFAAPGRQLVIEEPVPVSPVHAKSCVSGAQFADECAFVTDSGHSPAEKSYEQDAATIPGVHILDLDPMICPRLPICDNVLGQTLVRKDADHISARMSAQIADQIDWRLREEKIY